MKKGVKQFYVGSVFQRTESGQRLLAPSAAPLLWGLPPVCPGLSQRFWLSRAYFPFLLWVTLGFAALRQPVYGAMALLGICIWLLVFCRDLLASVMPFLLVFLLSTQRYESLGDFLPCAVLAAPFFAALIWT